MRRREEYRPAPLPCYAPGVWGGLLALPIGYWMEGYLLRDIIKGGTIRLDRRKRHGVPCRDLFGSTRIWRVSAPIITTLNSVYRVTEILSLASGASFAERN